MRIFHFDFNHLRLRREVVRDLLPQIAALGYDAILWELENQVAWDTCPECATPESWSKAEFAELLADSRALGLEPIPLLQTIGHGEYVMSHLRYHAFREHPDFSDCYCTSNPAVREFLIRWIDEYRELFGPLRYFHLGGDEAYRFGSCPACAARDRMALYAEHMGALAARLVAAGVRPGFWCDMILAHPQQLDAIPHDFLIWDWNYADGIEPPASIRVWGRGVVTRDAVTPELMRELPDLLNAAGEFNAFYATHTLRRCGFDVVLCSTARSAVDGPFTPNTIVHASNVVGAERTCARLGLVGHCVTSWAIRLNPLRLGLPLMALPAAVAAAPQADPATWRREVSQAHFGFAEGLDVADLISRANSRLRSFSALQWTGLKDAQPAPQGFLAGRIVRWTAEQEPWWTGRDAMLDDMRASVAKGLAQMTPHVGTSPLAADWVEAGRLEIDYLDLVQAIFTPNHDTVHLRQRLRDFAERLVHFYDREQCPLSARHNVGLIVDPLDDYLAHPTGVGDAGQPGGKRGR